MALKNINFKQLLMEKGEKIGLGVAAGIGVLLILWFLISAIAGNSSPGENVAELETLKNKAEERWKNSRPPEDLANLPPELQAVAVKPVDPEMFPTAVAYFLPSQGEDLKWRLPKVLAADEFAVNAVNGAIEAYYMTFSEETPKVYFLKEKKTGDPGRKLSKQQMDDWRTAFTKKAGKKLTTTSGTRSTPTPAPPAAPTQPQQPVPPGASAGKGGGSRNPEMAMPSLTSREGRTVYDNELGVDYIDKIDDSVKLAQTLLPREMVIVSGAFPYKQQLEEYRKAMRYGSVEELLADPNSARPEFMGFNVQRRKYNAEGKMIDDWTDIDVHADLKRLDMQAVTRAPEDPRLQELGIIVYPNRIVQPLPGLARGQKYPTPKLDSIDQTVDALLKSGNAPPPPKLGSRFQENLYDKERPLDTPSTTMPPAGASPGKGAGGRPADARSPGTTGQTAYAIPEKCLVRFIDADARHKPGNSYEYRIQILMSNPCHEKPERAISKTYTLQEAIEGPWQDVTWVQDGTTTSRIVIPEEQLYFVTDEKTEKSSGSANKDRAYVQIHRWLNEAFTKPDVTESKVPVGDWAISERREVRRGEYIGRVEEVEVTTWNPTQERFIMAIHPTEFKKGRVRRHNGIPVDFATDPGRPENPPLVVDFEGGEHTLTIAGRQVKDVGPVEMLILTSDGRLIVRNSQQDTDNPDRVTRVKTWKEWLDKVRSQVDGKPDDKNQLFPPNPGAGKSGSG